MLVWASLVARLSWFKGKWNTPPEIKIVEDFAVSTEQLDPSPTSCKSYVTTILWPSLSQGHSFITLILDRVGRKKPLLFGAVSFVALYSILAAIVATNPPVPGAANVSAQR